MAVLHLFDSSQFISAGVNKAVLCNGVRETQSSYESNEMPIGGVNFLLNKIHEYQKDDDSTLVFCFDRPPTIKRELHSEAFPHMNGYKGNRGKKEAHIPFQRAMAEDIVRQMGLNAVAVDGYEADDCIASLVKYYKNEYDHIYIHNGDSDLFYLVCDNVTNLPVRENGKTVTISNWEHTVKSGYVVPYNTLTIDKLITGEMGDNIPAIPKNMAERIINSIPKEVYTKCGNNVLLKRWISNATDGDKLVLNTLDLITPLILPYEVIELHEPEFDRDIFEYYAATCGNKYYKNYKPKSYALGEETVERYVNLYNNGR